VPWASHLQMLQRRLLRARRPRARLLACGSGQLGQAVREAKHSGKGAPRSTEISVRATARTHLGTALAHAGDIWRVGVLVDAADRIHSR
jgi:hypothetical protein